MVKDVHSTVRVFLPGIIRGKRGMGQGHKIIGMVGVIGMGWIGMVGMLPLGKALLRPHCTLDFCYPC